MNHNNLLYGYGRMHCAYNLLKINTIMCKQQGLLHNFAAKNSRRSSYIVCFIIYVLSIAALNTKIDCFVVNDFFNILLQASID